MSLCVGRIPFLVCAPFFYSQLLDGGAVRFVDGAPRRLAELLFAGRVHLTPCSSIAYAMHPGEFLLAPDICTSCGLEVRSVKLFSKVDLGDLGGRRVHLTSQSATSVALLKLLFALRFGICPEYVEGVPFNGELDAAKLLIGDEALLEPGEGFPFAYDLATLWLEWQGMPFVFGAWSIHKAALKMAGELSAYLHEVSRSVECFRRNPAAALKIWETRYPVPLPLGTKVSYYDALDYNFTEERKRSLELFFRLCEGEGLVPRQRPLEFFEG